MNTITALFIGSDGKMRRSYQVHINDNGKPLCRCKTRIGLGQNIGDKWVAGWSEPTCPVCIRMDKRRSLMV